jgi:hypothetical protein
MLNQPQTCGQVMSAASEGRMDNAVSEASKGESEHRDRQFTSRISVKHVVDAIEGFSEFRGGLLKKSPSHRWCPSRGDRPQPRGRKRRK